MNRHGLSHDEAKELLAKQRQLKVSHWMEEIDLIESYTGQILNDVQRYVLKDAAFSYLNQFPDATDMNQFWRFLKFSTQWVKERKDESN